MIVIRVGGDDRRNDRRHHDAHDLEVTLYQRIRRLPARSYRSGKLLHADVALTRVPGRRLDAADLNQLASLRPEPIFDRQPRNPQEMAQVVRDAY